MSKQLNSGPDTKLAIKSSVELESNEYDECDIGMIQVSQADRSDYTDSDELRNSYSASLGRPPHLTSHEHSLRLGSAEVDRQSRLSYPKSVAMSVGTYNQHPNSNNTPIWKHPRLRKNPKTIGAAVFLLIFGLAFMAAGSLAVVVSGTSPRLVIFILIGCLMALPGGYQTFYIYRAMKGHPGYHFSGIPSFD
eukprot:Partr_v1_DN27913_c0_g1_i1_m11924 putative Transmembrane protein 230